MRDDAKPDKRPLRVYLGWEVYDNGKGHHPTTGRFVAWRFGVRIGHPSLDGLLRMIDVRAEDSLFRRS